MRPMYETEQDRGAEERVVQLLCDRWECRWWKLPIAYRLDYSLSRGDEVEAWVEIKCRNKSYPEMNLSLHKWMAGKELNRATGLPFILVYAFGDEVYWRAVENDNPKVIMWGRTDRNDWQDIEPTVVFPLDGFKHL